MAVTLTIETLNSKMLKTYIYMEYLKAPYLHSSLNFILFLKFTLNPTQDQNAYGLHLSSNQLNKFIFYPTEAIHQRIKVCNIVVIPGV